MHYLPLSDTLATWPIIRWCATATWLGCPTGCASMATTSRMQSRLCATTRQTSRVRSSAWIPTHSFATSSRAPAARTPSAVPENSLVLPEIWGIPSDLNSIAWNLLEISLRTLQHNPKLTGNFSIVAIVAHSFHISSDTFHFHYCLLQRRWLEYFKELPYAMCA